MFSSLFPSPSNSTSPSTSSIICPKLEISLTNNSQVADLCLGVIDVTVGYTGGLGAYPTYRSIKDHTEGVRVTFDPNIITYDEILESFFEQLGDGIYYPSYSCQYRSAILVHNQEQRDIANRFIELKKAGGRKVHVDVENASDFYKAEEYHQKYYLKSRSY